MEKNTKSELLLIGDTTWPMYVNALYRASKSIIKTDLLDFGVFNIDKAYSNIIFRIENKIAFGIFNLIMNIRIIRHIKHNEYKYVFFYNPRLVSWRVYKYLEKRGIVTAIYCNDNPFSDYYPRYFWRNIRKGVKYCDITYSYRNENISRYYECGAKKVALLRSYYNSDRSFLKSDFNDALYVPKVVFLGHMEDDERRDYLNELLKNNIEIGVRKTEEWEKFAQERKNVIVFEETVSHYNEILNKAEIAIVFLSKINNDTYTRRCFEIPITGTLMLAPYNEDLASLFMEDKEVVFYRSKKEFVDKIRYYLNHPDQARKIGLQGRTRVLNDGHSAEDRIKQILSDMSCCKRSI